MTATLAAPAAPAVQPVRFREWQREALDAVREAWYERGLVRIAGVAATGLGKTTVIGATIKEEVDKGGRVLVLAHRDMLLAQIRDTVHRFDPTIGVGWVQGAKSQVRYPVTVAMVQTFGSRVRTIARMREILDDPSREREHTKARRRLQSAARKLPQRPTLVIVDECHRTMAQSYLDVLTWAGCFDEDDPTRLLGLTATFTRGDKRGLADVYEKVVFTYGIGYGVAQGYLVPPRGIAVKATHVDLDKARTSRGDYTDSDLGEMVVQDVDEIVRGWLDHAFVDEQAHPGFRPPGERIGGRLYHCTAAFVPTVASAEALALAFQTAGVPAEYLTGDTPTGERDAMYARLAAGETKVLVNVYVLVEGWDCPQVSCVLMARPTKLPGVYQQAVGRCLRLCPEIGKPYGLVLDVVGTSRRNTLQTLVDLLPSAEYRPLVEACEVCGGYTAKSAPAVARAIAEGYDACLCPCRVCGEIRPECTCKPERDPDGGRIRLQGPAAYEEIDLLGGADGLAASPLHWLKTPGGVCFVDAGQYLAAVVEVGERADGTKLYRAGYCTYWPGGESGDLVDVAGVPMAEARAAVEDWARTQPHCYPRAARWRHTRERASEKAQLVARRLGIAHPERYTKGGLADAIAIERARRRFDR